MNLLAQLQNPEFRLGEFLMPWGMAVSALGFVAAWIIVAVLEHWGWTRHIGQLPIFFVALAVICGCLLGLVLAP